MVDNLGRERDSGLADTDQALADFWIKSALGFHTCDMCIFAQFNYLNIPS